MELPCYKNMKYYDSPFNTGFACFSPEADSHKTFYSKGFSPGHRAPPPALKGESYEIPFSVICVLTMDKLAYPDEIFNFFVENKIKRIAFNIDEINAYNKNSTFSAEQAEEMLYKFISRFYFLCMNHPDSPSVREFSHVAKLISLSRNESFQVGSFMLRPGGYIIFDVDGNFSTFSPEMLSMKYGEEKDFVLGNVFNDDLEEAFQLPKLNLLNSEIQSGVNKCSESCEYFKT